MCFSFDEIKSFRWLVWGIFWSVLYMCPFFSAMEFSNIVWWASSMQFNFTSYVRVSSSVSFCRKYRWNNYYFFWKPYRPFSQCFCVNCQLMFHSVYFNSCFFFKNNNRAFYCNCSSVAALMPEFFCDWRKLEGIWTFWVAFMFGTWSSNKVQTLKKQVDCNTLLLPCVGE